MSILKTYKHRPSKPPSDKPKRKMPDWELVGIAAICILLLVVTFMAYQRGERVDYLDAKLVEQSQVSDRLAKALASREGTITVLTAELTIRRQEVASLTAQVASLTAQVDTLTISLRAAERREARPTTPPRTSHTPNPSRNTSGVEQWRSLVARYFEARYVNDALSVMRQESGGNPNAKGPMLRGGHRCKGLFQQHSKYWAARAARAGFAGASPFDPTANVAVSAMLSRRGADWSHWCAQP